MKSDSKEIRKKVKVSDLQRLTFNKNEACKFNSKKEALIASEILKRFSFLIHKSKPVKYGDCWILSYKYPFNEEIFYVNDPG